MKNEEYKFFRCLRPDVDVRPLREEIHQNEKLWGFDTGRQDSVECQRETNMIPLRGVCSRPDIGVNENQESAWSKISDKFPLACEFMKNVAESEGGTLCRAVIVRLQPKGKVYPHIDTGSYYFIRDRYHLVISSKEGSILASGDEKVTMKEGELWWFDNKQHHAAVNKSDEWRIHYIFDVLPQKFESLGKNPQPPSSFFKYKE